MEHVVISLVPCGGLCNRMNAILSAIAVVRNFGDKYIFNIYWRKSHDCYADFSQLFFPIKEDNIRIVKLNKFYLIGGVESIYTCPILSEK